MMVRGVFGVLAARVCFFGCSRRLWGWFCSWGGFSQREGIFIGAWLIQTRERARGGCCGRSWGWRGRGEPSVKVDLMVMTPSRSEGLNLVVRGAESARGEGRRFGRWIRCCRQGGRSGGRLLESVGGDFVGGR